MQTKRTLAVFLSIATLVAASLFPLPLVAGQGRVSSPIADQSTTPDGPQGKIVKSYRVTPDGVEANRTPGGKQGNRTKPKDVLPDWVNEALERSLAHFAQRKGALRVDNPATELKLLGVDQDDLGKTHVRLDQYHQGVEVFGGQVISHLDDSEAVEVSGRLFEVGQIDTTPSLDPAQAIETAQAALGYSGKFANPPTVKLVVLPNSMIKGDEATGATLTYQVELRIEDGTEATAHHQYFVNAIDRSIVWHFNSLPTATGSGHSLYSGTVQIPTTYDPGGFGTYSLKNGRNDTMDLKNKTTGGETFSRFSHNVWGDGAASNRESAAVDAHYGAIKTLDYFLNIYGRNGMDGKGTALVTKVHFGSNRNEAYGNGTEVTFGDGDGVTFSPLVSMDVVAHEITHGVTAWTAGLIYANESGAINESFSDIFGTAVEFYDGRNPDYLLGEDCFTPATAGDALRSMADPTLCGDPDHYAKRYTGTDDDGGVHSNSGIMNKAFYLLAEGGIHPHSRVQVPGIGRRSAERIFFRALTTYLTKDARFRQARQATLAAAFDLFNGNNTLEYRATELAWEAVGVKPVDKHDYNRDGQSDLLLHNQRTGEIQAWFMIGTDRKGYNSIKEQATQQVHRLTAPWRIAATGDINGDNNTDLLLHNTSTGEIQVWFMNGTDRVGYNSVKEQATQQMHWVAAPWKLVGSGDFDRDGQMDIVWRDQSTGEIQVWFMSGTDRKGYNSIKEQATQGTHYLSQNWMVKGVADMNRDGREDILLHNLSTGEIQVWFMEGTDRVSYNSVKEQSTQQMHRVTAPWQLVGTGMVNQDRWVDLIFHNIATGEIQVWFMNGTDRIGYNSVKEQATQQMHRVAAPWQLVTP